MKNKAVVKAVLGIVLGIVLTACGGGGGGVRPEPPGPGTKVCPDGSVIPADQECPVEPEPPTPIPPDGQAFRGQSDLVAKVTAGGRALQVKVFIWDPTYEMGNTNPLNHYNAVKKQLTDIGIPESNIIGTGQLSGATIGDPSTYTMNRFFNDAEWAGQRASTFVVALPSGGPYTSPGTAAQIAAHNVLFVAAAGNTAHDVETGELILADRDYYQPTHPSWGTEDALDGQPDGYSSYQETIDALQTDKALVAVWADVDAEGNVVPYASSVKCGNAGNSCFTMILPSDLHGSIGYGTSFATPRLAAAAYYLRQLWNNAEEVTGVLRTCAIDIGAPGVDDEFGAGAVNVDCAAVDNKEVQVVGGSVRTEARSPALDAMTGHGADPTNQRPSFSFVAGHQAATDQDGTVTGPEVFISNDWLGIGRRLRFNDGEVVTLVGMGTTPLGVHSRFVQTERVAFVEMGGRKDLLRLDESTSLSAVGTLGYDTGKMDALVSRAGLQVARKEGNSSLRFYAGYIRVDGKIGIPGRKDVVHHAHSRGTALLCFEVLKPRLLIPKLYSPRAMRGLFFYGICLHTIVPSERMRWTYSPSRQV